MIQPFIFWTETQIEFQKYFKAFRNYLHDLNEKYNSNETHHLVGNVTSTNGIIIAKANIHKYFFALNTKIKDYFSGKFWVFLQRYTVSNI